MLEGDRGATALPVLTGGPADCSETRRRLPAAPSSGSHDLSVPPLGPASGPACFANAGWRQARRMKEGLRTSPRGLTACCQGYDQPPPLSRSPPRRTRTRLRVTTIKDSRTHRIGLVVQEASHRRHLLFNPHVNEPDDAGIRQPRTNTNSPKSLSSVISIRPSSKAMDNTSMSEAVRSRSVTDDTSCPRPISMRLKGRDDAHTSKEEFMGGYRTARCSCTCSPARER